MLRMSMTKASDCSPPVVPEMTIGVPGTVVPVLVGTMVRTSSVLVSARLVRKVCAPPTSSVWEVEPRASMEVTRLPSASVGFCAWLGPSEVRLVPPGSVAVTTLPLLLLFCTIGAEPGVLPLLVIVSAWVFSPEPGVVGVVGVTTTGGVVGVVVSGAGVVTVMVNS